MKRATQFLVVLAVILASFSSAAIARVTAGDQILSRAPAVAPVFNSPYADRAVEPTYFSPTYVIGQLTENQLSNYARNVTWASWGGAEASGRGQVSLLNGTTETSPVTIKLGDLESCAGVSTYTSYELSLDSGAAQPKRWPVGSSARFPCDIYLAGPLYGNYQGISSRGHACTQGLTVDHAGRAPANSGGGLVDWRPALPVAAAQHIFCRFKWDHWGTAKVTGTGYLLAMTQSHRDRRFWPARIELSGAAWCPAAGQETPMASAITYGDLRATLYGSPRPLLHGRVPASVFGELEGKQRSFTQHLRPSARECWLGFSDPDPEGIEKPFQVRWGQPDG